ncbi:hypothetical protein PIIN_03232 [Serendipita indica DSM 11827]|uniref:Protein kinase domain-containing protein n=1 Tax=Serendipita indica (strain DSM 11827) TaxID=1109443 RepID=G4TDD1_SERID|nr:hypothetical protein PIIN_03232 [Serendipita indica DSM 11827]
MLHASRDISIQALLKKIALLREENDELADERRRLRKKVTRFETQVGTLNKIIEEQDLEIDSLRTLDAAQRRQITRLKERLGDQEAELEELRDNWETHILCCPMFEGSDSSFELELPPQSGYGSIYGAILRSNLPEAGEPMNVAVKRLKRADYGTFRRECIVLQALRGTGIVPNPYAFGQDEGHFYIERFPTCLWNQIALHGVVQEEECQALIKDVLLLLKRFHETGFVHFDIKADNVLVSREGRLVMCDTGLSMPESHAFTVHSGWGSKGYRAPEVEACRPLDNPFLADIYSVGAMLCAWRGTVLLSAIQSQGDVDTMVEDAFPEREYPVAHDFLRRVMSFEPQTRLSAVDALEHAWIKADTIGTRNVGWLQNVENDPYHYVTLQPASIEEIGMDDLDGI